jgi:hypothetical protein
LYTPSAVSTSSAASGGGGGLPPPPPPPQALRQISAAIVTSPFRKLAENRSIPFAITTLRKSASPILEVKLYLARQISPVGYMIFS